MKKAAVKVTVKVRPLTPERWADLEALFGENGACAGCWCMYWRLEKGERFEDVKGPVAKRRMRALVAKGEARGLLAYVGEVPVGWVTLGPRRSFPKLDRAPSLACGDAERVWSVPCFFVHKDHRSAGVATALLSAAVAQLKKEGAHVLEGYPVKPSRPGAPIPAAFAYTGTVPLFTKQGFEVVAPKPAGKQRARLSLGRAKAKGQGRRTP